MNTQTAAVATKKTSAASRKAAAAAKFSDNPVVQAAAETAIESGAQAVTILGGTLVADLGGVGTGAAKAAKATKRASRVKVLKGDAAELEVATVVAAPAKVAKRPAKKTAEAEFTPAVVKDTNNHTAIAVAQTGKMVEIIPMDGAGLAVVKVSRDRFAHDYKQVDGYPVPKAARVYLTQAIAMDPKAKAVLELLAAAEADKPIASGVLVAVMSKHDEAATVTAAATGSAPSKQTRKAARAVRADKPTGHRAPSTELAKVISKGPVTVESKVQPGSFRAARHSYIVSMAGKTVADVLGASVLEGKRAVAFRDIQFAVSHGFITLA